MPYFYSYFVSICDINREELMSRDQKDSDVFVEQLVVLGDRDRSRQAAPVVVSGLTKYYGAFKAVDGLYLQIEKAECFGLLGRIYAFNYNIRVTLVQWVGHESLKRMVRFLFPVDHSGVRKGIRPRMLLCHTSTQYTLILE